MVCGAAGLDIFKRINTCVSGAGGVSLCRSAVTCWFEVLVSKEGV